MHSKDINGIKTELIHNLQANLIPVHHREACQLISEKLGGTRTRYLVEEVEDKWQLSLFALIRKHTTFTDIYC